MKTLIVDNVSKNYGRTRALHNVSFTLDKNEVVGLLGRNGAGKSTLLKIIAGIMKPDSGEVRLEDVLEIRGKSYQKNISYLSEKNPLYPHLYTGEYLAWIASVYEVKNIKNQVKHIVETVGLSEVRHKKIGHLSKGFRQRLGLAAALIPDPEIIVLDEPVNGLDPTQILQYREVIKGLAQRKKIILSSHLLQEIEALSDRIILIENGQLKMDKGKQDLLMIAEKRVYKILFDKEVDKKAIASLSSVSQVSETGTCEFEVISDSGYDIRGDLFDLAVGKGVKLIGLTEQTGDLKNLFTDSK